jgi:hypothetical protein
MNNPGPGPQDEKQSEAPKVENQSKPQVAGDKRPLRGYSSTQPDDAKRNEDLPGHREKGGSVDRE